MAIITRWRWPPESSCGNAFSRFRLADANLVQKLQRAGAGLVATHALMQFKDFAICRSIECSGLSEVIAPERSW